MPMVMEELIPSTRKTKVVSEPIIEHSDDELVAPVAPVKRTTRSKKVVETAPESVAKKTTRSKSKKVVEAVSESETESSPVVAPEAVEGVLTMQKPLKIEKRVYIKITTIVTTKGSEHTMELSAEKLKADKTKGEQVFRKTVIGQWDISMPTTSIKCLFSYRNNVIQSVMAFYDNKKAVNKFFKELTRMYESLSTPEMEGFDGKIESTITRNTYMATMYNSDGELDPTRSIIWKLI